MSTLKVNTITPESGTTVSITGEIVMTGANMKYFSNPNNLTSNVTVNYGSTHNFAVVGPVQVVSPAVWTVSGGTGKII